MKSVYQKLKGCAQKLGVVVKETKREEDRYDAEMETIFIKKSNYKHLAPIFSHELGHHISHNKTSKRKNKAIGDAYFAYFWGLPLTKKEKALIFIEEFEAWKLAKRALKKANYKDWKVFDNIMRYALYTYKMGLEL